MFPLSPESPHFKRKGEGAGLCFSHAKIEGFIKAESIKKQYDASSKSHSKRKVKENPIVLDNEEGRTSKKIKEILCLNDFDLKEAIKTYELAGEPVTQEHIQHMLYIQWFNADFDTKYPQSTKEFAEILGVSLTTVRGWLSSEWFGGDIDHYRANLFQLMSQFTDRQMMIGVLDNDNQSIKEFYRQKEILDEKMQKGKVRSLESKLGKDIIDEANKRREGKSKRRTVAEKEIIHAFAPQVAKKKLYGDH